MRIRKDESFSDASPLDPNAPLLRPTRDATGQPGTRAIAVNQSALLVITQDVHIPLYYTLWQMQSGNVEC